MLALIGSAIILNSCLTIAAPVASDSAVDIGHDRELFVDRYLIDRLDGTQLKLHHPTDRGKVLAFDKPWEGPFCAYLTVMNDDGRYRMYYRGDSGEGATGSVTCYAESEDGITWTKPVLGLYEYEGSNQNNIVLGGFDFYISRNFCPMIDANPAASDEYRYKAIAGRYDSGDEARTPSLYALGSPDGIHWRMMAEKPVVTFDSFAFDSENVAFWSASEQKYLLYCRVWVDDPDPVTPPNADIEWGIRTIARAESDDYIHWTAPRRMTYSDTETTVPSNHFYTNQTHPYFRAPQIYMSFAARFMPGRRAVKQELLKQTSLDATSGRDISDTTFMTTRGGYRFDRTFLGSFVRPGIGAQNWVTRSNYAALNSVQTGPNELSIYLNKDYGQTTAYVNRYSLRLDGFASVNAGYEGGEMVTKPLRFSGNRLLLNFSTSSSGDLCIEIQDTSGNPIPGFTLDDCELIIGDEIDRPVTWAGGDLQKLAGQPVRLRFVMRDADLYAIQFVDDM